MHVIMPNLLIRHVCSTRELLKKSMAFCPHLPSEGVVARVASPSQPVRGFVLRQPHWEQKLHEQGDYPRRV